MNVRIALSLAILGIFLMGNQAPSTKQNFGNEHNVELTFKNLRSKKGKLVIGVAKNQESFESEKSDLLLSFSKEDMNNGWLQVQFHLEPDVYGFSILDDENSNGEMDYNFIGIPKEGFGFSNYYHTGFTKPHFDKFKFNLSKNEKIQIEVRVRYI